MSCCLCVLFMTTCVLAKPTKRRDEERERKEPKKEKEERKLKDKKDKPAKEKRDPKERRGSVVVEEEKKVRPNPIIFVFVQI